MKTPIKTLAFSAAASFVLLACNNAVVGPNERLSDSSVLAESSDSGTASSSSGTTIPAMDYRVVSYKKNSDVRYGSTNGHRFIVDEDTLKADFPHIFEEKRAECNYFGIYLVSASHSLKHYILSQDMLLYMVTPGSGTDCGITTDMIFNAMLVCDDTAEGNLKDRINLSSIQSYVDSSWDCSEGEQERGVFF